VKEATLAYSSCVLWTYRTAFDMLVCASCCSPLQ
jgi:hypothetical protein